MDDRWQQHLSGIMKEIAELIGLQGTIKLWSRFRYQEIWIAEDWMRNKELIELIGETETQKLSHFFASENIFIPNKSIEDILLANRVLIEDKAGLSTVYIAKKLGISRKRVYLLRKRYAEASKFTYLSDDQGLATGQDLST